MKTIEASCPSCGSPVAFKASSSLVTVCSSCDSIVARGDRKLEDHGKVAAIVATNSAFHLGQSGRYRDHPFEIIGHVQYQHPAGGYWDEWYASFPGDRWCWIAEAQGKRYLTQQKEINNHMSIPSWNELTVGANIALGTDRTYTVEEINTATFAAAEGEIPISVAPGSRHRFADLKGDENRFGTIAYGDQEVTLYLGREVTLEDLGIAPPKSDDQSALEISGKSVSCPQCGGALELRAPDQALRVTCPYCSSLLDVEQGNLKYLTTLDLKIEPRIPIGTSGTLRATEFVVIGFVRRGVHFDREYTWDEYLLYESSVGFRWLVESDRNWSFVEPLPASKSTTAPDGGFSGQFEGTTFRIFQRAWARVVHVLGEFYWKVSIGETVLAEDYIAPPRMITIELTPENPQLVSGHASDGWMETRFTERIMSLGTYLSHSEVETAFRLPALPRSAVVAPNQPAPDYRSSYMLWPLMVLILLGIDIIVSNLVRHPVHHSWTFLAVLFLSFYPAGLWLHGKSIEQSRWGDSEFSPYGHSD